MSPAASSPRRRALETVFCSPLVSIASSDFVDVWLPDPPVVEALPEQFIASPH
jgi:hypothetical protein